MSRVLITGASSGLGLALARHYLKQGFDVIACGRSLSKLQQVFSDLRNQQNKQDTGANQLHFLAFDITDSEQISDAINTISEPLELVILNAGDCQYIDDVMQFNSQAFADVINTNLVSVGKLLAVLLPKIPVGGQLVFISSIVTTMPFPRSHAYGASKAGLDYLANTLRFDLKDKNIDVGLIHPGFIKTPLTDKNDFPMPFLLTSEDAASRIFTAISKRKSYFHFPKRFTYLLKFMRFMPDFLWHKAVFRS